MPNWVTVRVIADDRDVLDEKLLDENGNVDFNILCPLSEDLDITSGSWSYSSDMTKLNKKLSKYYDKEVTQKEFVDRVLKEENINELLLASSSQEWIKGFVDEADNDRKIEDISNIIKGYFNHKRYGFVDWYSAHNQVWGTKWNACETIHCGYEVQFKTAWAAPFPVLYELSKYTPITVAFADEDIGSNYGILRIENGKETEYTPDKNNFAEAVAVHDEYLEDYLNEGEEPSEEDSKGYEETVKLLSSLGFCN